MIDRPVVSALCRIFFTGVGVGAVSLRTGTLVENGALVKRRIVWLGVIYYGRRERMIFVHEVNDFKAEAIKRPWERVAQPVEHVTFNHGVLGSSPSALTIAKSKIYIRFLEDKTERNQIR